MRFLFIVQGEGRGHLTQALTLEEQLRREGHEVVEMLVGKSQSRELPPFFIQRAQAPVRRFESPNFLPTPAHRKNNLTGSILYNAMRLPTFAQSILFIRSRIRDCGADVVVNFYELLTGMTYLFFRPKARQVCIGHQYLFLHKDFRFPPSHSGGLGLLKLFTRLTAIGADRMLALSFHRMPDNERQHLFVVPPLLRKEVLRQPTSEGDYIHGYMVNSGFSSQVRQWHEAHPATPLRFFWDKKGEKEVRHVDATLSFHPLNDRSFLEQLGGCRAYASTAGFESVCEAMYMGKPVLMVPAHIEQECNAFDAEQAGAGIVSENFQLDRLLTFCTHYRRNVGFVFWAQQTELLLERLTEWQEAEEPHTALAQLRQTLLQYKPDFYDRIFFR